MSDLRYEKPASVAEAVRLLAAEPGRAAALAGGTDLMVAMRAGRATGQCPELLVDLKGITELERITWTEDGTLRIGACVRIQDLAGDARIQQTFPALAEAAGNIGSLQVRHRATVGGNLGNASPCADTAPPLLVLAARLVVAGDRQSREIPLDQFFQGVKQVALTPGEIIIEVVVPPAPAGLRTGFGKVKRIRGHDLALVNAAAAWVPGSAEVKLALGSVAPTPMLVPGLDNAGAGNPSATELGERLAAAALAATAPIDDVRASAEYRRDMIAMLCRRLAATLLDVPASQTGGR
ncbi:MAG: xanthine dehydrogenase family protein subunit M [bacterium]